MAPVQRVEENRRSLELRNGRIPRIFRNNLAYEDDTNSQFACILRNFGLEHSFVHLQTAAYLTLRRDRFPRSTPENPRRANFSESDTLQTFTVRPGAAPWVERPAAP